ncbi:hypothetical protein Lal_00017685, partial [Lupinus albus]
FFPLTFFFYFSLLEKSNSQYSAFCFFTLQILFKASLFFHSFLRFCLNNLRSSYPRDIKRKWEVLSGFNSILFLDFGVEKVKV